MDYVLRAATLDDLDVLVHHRVAMFTDMGVPIDAAAVGAAFAAWLRGIRPAGTYRAWVAEDGAGTVVGGAGATILPWPPGPTYPGDTLAFVYNVYTEPAHRRHGLARLLMDQLHGWCAANGVTSIALNASRDGLPLYESLGYQVSPSPMMFFSLLGV